MTLKTRGNAGCVPHILGILPFRCVLCRMTRRLEVYPTPTHRKVQEFLHENSQFGLRPATIYYLQMFFFWMLLRTFSILFPTEFVQSKSLCVNHDHSAMWNNVILRGSSILNHLLGFPSFCCATSIQIHPKLICWNLSLSSISGLLGVSLIHTRPWRRSVTERTGKGALVSPGWPREGWWSASTSWINFLVLRKSNSNSDSQITVQLICVEVS